ncbi:hypothetical protein [Methylobacterium durans]|uniref:hypothetical protein n=1 Tax=Methylobacterium durans TaxID=2202825 RepID=UPI0013A52D9F|nr:hypothetical protein [Methylobacterium durans]
MIAIITRDAAGAGTDGPPRIHQSFAVNTRRRTSDGLDGPCRNSPAAAWRR